MGTSNGVLHCSWAKAVTQEFFAQGDQEAALGLPISPLMDRHKSSLPLSQINFIEFIVAPLFFKVSFPATMHRQLQEILFLRALDGRLESLLDPSEKS